MYCVWFNACCILCCLMNHSFIHSFLGTGTGTHQILVCVATATAGTLYISGHPKNDELVSDQRKLIKTLWHQLKFSQSILLWLLLLSLLLPCAYFLSFQSNGDSASVGIFGRIITTFSAGMNVWIHWVWESQSACIHTHTHRYTQTYRACLYLYHHRRCNPSRCLHLNWNRFQRLFNFMWTHSALDHRVHSYELMRGNEGHCSVHSISNCCMHSYDDGLSCEYARTLRQSSFFSYFLLWQKGGQVSW